jgi:hypothetical protein
MAHWQNRKEQNWSNFRFNQPYANGVKRLREEVLAKTDFDPAVLWQWGTMQAMSVIQILRDCEQEFGEKGQQVVNNSLRKIGRDVGSQLFSGLQKPGKLAEAEIISFFCTVVNRIVYASLEDPRIDGKDKVSFDILWCPHQDHYSAFDCRVQRYLVQGMLDALSESGWIGPGWQVKFTCTIPAGARVCTFVLWKASPQEQAEWELYTKKLEQRALKEAAKRS